MKLVRRGALAIVIAVTVFQVSTGSSVGVGLSVLGSVVFVFLLGRAMEGRKRMLLFVGITIVCAFIGEDLGVRTGITFGAYQYSNILGPQLDKVPLLVLLTYFTAGYVSLTIARLITGASARPRGMRLIGLATAASFVMVGWDVAMDPQSSTIYGWWIWTKGGNYFGIPLHNFWGWFLLNFVIFLAYLLVTAYLVAPKPDPESETRALWTEPLVFWLTYAAIVIVPPAMSYGFTFSKLNVARPTPISPDQVAWSIALVAVFTMLGPIVFAANRLRDPLPLGDALDGRTTTGQSDWRGLMRDPATITIVAAIVIYIAGVFALGLQGGYTPLR